MHYVRSRYWTITEPPHDKTNEMARAPSESSGQPGHPPSLIRVFAVRMKKVLVLSYPLSAQQRLWYDWADAQAELSLQWAHMQFCWFCHEAAQLIFRRWLQHLWNIIDALLNFKNQTMSHACIFENIFYLSNFTVTVIFISSHVCFV